MAHLVTVSFSIRTLFHDLIWFALMNDVSDNLACLHFTALTPSDAGSIPDGVIEIFH